MLWVRLAADKHERWLRKWLECIMPIKVKELVVRKKESVTQGMCPRACPLLLHFSGLSASCTERKGGAMRKEGNAYWNSFKVRLSSSYSMHRNRKYLNLTWVPVLLLCDSWVCNTSSSLKCFKLIIDGVFTLEYLSNCNSHKTWCPSAQTTTFQKCQMVRIKRLSCFLISMKNIFCKQLLRFIFIFECMYMWRGYSHMCPPCVSVKEGPQEAVKSLELEVQGVVSCQPWFLETELKSPKRGASALNCCAISP